LQVGSGAIIERPAGSAAEVGGMEFKDYYRVLNLARTASAEEIRKSYRRLARRFHPDVSKETNAEERFKEVQEAYEVLKDPEKRAAYDQLGGDYRPGQQFRPPRDFGSRFEFRGEPNDQGYSDFFESLFGSGSPFTQAGGARPRRGQDSHARLEVTLEEVAHGGPKTIELRHPELADGELALKTRTLRVTVPKGVAEGQLIRLAGQGEGSAGGAGDLYLEVRYAPHPLYAVEGRDLTLTLPIAPWEAALGASIQVPTLAGQVEMKVPAGARAGQRLRLKGRGLPGDPPGDEYLLLKVVLPPATSARARELYETLARELPFDPRAELAVRS
jgi:curved DNA-binding protein